MVSQGAAAAARASVLARRAWRPGSADPRSVSIPTAAFVAPVAQIAYDLPREDQPNGLAQLLFLTQEDVETFGSHPFVTRYIREDEQNLCDRNAHQWFRDHSAHTVKDITNESEPQGPPIHPAFVIGLQKQQQHYVEAFNEFIVGTLAPEWTGMQEVLRLRYHLLEPYVEHEGQSPNVGHDWADVKQYQAWIELSVRHERSARDLLTVVTENELRTLVAMSFTARQSIPNQDASSSSRSASLSGAVMAG
jgi:hypothetical protein